MTSRNASRRRGRLSPSAAIAVTAATAGALASGCGLALWMLAPALATPFLIAAPAGVALATWFAARRSVGAALAAAQETMRAHAAVARLMAAGMRRLAQADTAARIAVDLPAPYAAFGPDFNAAAQELATALAENAALRSRLGGHAGQVEEAAERLGARAGRLASRIETELRIIDALAGHDPAEALRIARHIMEGAGVAARRNMAAADDFTAMARQLRQDVQAETTAEAANAAPSAGVAA